MWFVGQVRGDAFLARVLDDGERFERRDLTVADVSSTADWVRAAAAQNERKRREESADVKLSRIRPQVRATFFCPSRTVHSLLENIMYEADEL